MSKEEKVQKESTEEVFTIEVLSNDVIDMLDEGIKKDVKYLVKSLGATEMQPLNPIVLAFQNLLPYKELQYDKENDNTQEYTDAWKEIRSFNAEMKRTKSTLKKDVDKIGKAIISVEKSFLSASDEIMEKLQENFKEYLDEKEAKKAEAQKKKDAAMAEKIESIQTEAEEAMQKAILINAYNKVKYEVLEDFKQKRISSIALLNKTAIEQGILDVREMRMPHIVKTYDVLEEWEILDEEKQMEMSGKLKDIKLDIVNEYEKGLKALAEQAFLENTENQTKATWRGPDGPAPADDEPFRNSVNGPVSPPAEVFSMDVEKNNALVGALQEYVKYYNNLITVNSGILPFKTKARIMSVVDGIRDVMENVDKLNKL